MADTIDLNALLAKAVSLAFRGSKSSFHFVRRGPTEAPPPPPSANFKHLFRELCFETGLVACRSNCKAPIEVVLPHGGKAARIRCTKAHGTSVIKSYALPIENVAAVYAHVLTLAPRPASFPPVVAPVPRLAKKDDSPPPAASRDAEEAIHRAVYAHLPPTIRLAGAAARAIRVTAVTPNAFSFWWAGLQCAQPGCTDHIVTTISRLHAGSAWCPSHKETETKIILPLDVVDELARLVGMPAAPAKRALDDDAAESAPKRVTTAAPAAGRSVHITTKTVHALYERLLPSLPAPFVPRGTNPSLIELVKITDEFLTLEWTGFRCTHVPCSFHLRTTLLNWGPCDVHCPRHGRLGKPYRIPAALYDEIVALIREQLDDAERLAASPPPPAPASAPGAASPPAAASPPPALPAAPPAPKRAAVAHPRPSAPRAKMLSFPEFARGYLGPAAEATPAAAADDTPRESKRSAALALSLLAADDAPPAPALPPASPAPPARFLQSPMAKEDYARLGELVGACISYADLIELGRAVRTARSMHATDAHAIHLFTMIAGDKFILASHVNMFLSVITLPDRPLGDLFQQLLLLLVIDPWNSTDRRAFPADEVAQMKPLPLDNLRILNLNKRLAMFAKSGARPSA